MPVCPDLWEESGTGPRDWQIANVVPLFKRGSHSPPQNYRPLKAVLTVPPFRLLTEKVRMSEQPDAPKWKLDGLVIPAECTDLGIELRPTEVACTWGWTL
ncbi:hypothetical protein XELAEV_18008658mg [Xenopus laevis]|uniref:Uncharacterized protein n=1 Tax=Xenopus laevis TaxID=8355 RepID=A0A974HZP4_XENLA|nr:hypothetical protein XELAEV_18008658mg [Xenopus laevis]